MAIKEGVWSLGAEVTRQEIAADVGARNTDTSLTIEKPERFIWLLPL